MAGKPRHKEEDKRTFRLKSRSTTTRCPPSWTKNRLASMYIQLFAEISERRGLSQSAQANLALSSTSTKVEGGEMGQFNSRGSLKLTHIRGAPGAQSRLPPKVGIGVSRIQSRKEFSSSNIHHVL